MQYPDLERLEKAVAAKEKAGELFDKLLRDKEIREKLEPMLDETIIAEALRRRHIKSELNSLRRERESAQEYLEEFTSEQVRSEIYQQVCSLDVQIFELSKGLGGLDKGLLDKYDAMWRQAENAYWAEEAQQKKAEKAYARAQAIDSLVIPSLVVFLVIAFGIILVVDIS